MKIAIILISVCHFIISNAQEDSKDFQLKASDAFNNKQYEQAVSWYNKSIKLDRTNTESLFWRGMTYIQLTKYKNAIADFSTVLKLIPDHRGALMNRAIAYNITKKHVNAFADYEKLESLDSSDATMYLNRGISYMSIKNYKAAVKDFTNAIKFDPYNWNLYNKRSECYNYLGDVDLAIMDLKRLLILKPDVDQAKSNLAFCFTLKQQYTKADSIYSKIYARNQEDPFLLNNYGFTLYKLGNSKDGLELMQRSVSLDPSNSYVYKNLAIIYLEQQDIAMACKYINKGLSYKYTQSYGNELLELQKKHCK